MVGKFSLAGVIGLGAVFKALAQAEKDLNAQLQSNISNAKISTNQMTLIANAMKLNAKTLAEQNNWAGANLKTIRDIVDKANDINQVMSSLTTTLPKIDPVAIPTTPTTIPTQNTQDENIADLMSLGVPGSFPPRLPPTNITPIGEITNYKDSSADREAQYQGMIVGKTRSFPKGKADKPEKEIKPPKEKDSKALKSAFDSMGMMAAKAFAIIGIATVIGGLMTAMFPFQDLFIALTDIFSIYGEIISASFTPIIQALYEVLLSEAVMANIQLLSDAFLALFLALVPLIPQLLPLGALLINGLIMGINFLVANLPVLAPLFTALMAGIMAILPYLIQIGSIFATTLFTALDLLTPLFEDLGPVMDTLMPYIVALAAAFGGAILTALTLLQPILDLLLPVVAVVFAALVAGITAFFNAIKDSKSIIGAVINGIIGFINAAITAINLIPGVNIPLVPTVALASGGIVTSPTIALIGEAGPEAVVPLNGSNKSGIGGGVTINVYGDLTESKKNELIRELWLKGIA